MIYKFAIYTFAFIILNMQTDIISGNVYEIARGKNTKDNCNTTFSPLEVICHPEYIVDGNLEGPIMFFTYPLIQEKELLSSSYWIQIDLDDNYLATKLSIFPIKAGQLNYPIPFLLLVYIYIGNYDYTNIESIEYLTRRWYAFDLERFIHDNMTNDLSDNRGYFEEGRYVTFKIRYFYNPISEIQLFTLKGINAARFKTASQSSTLYNDETSWKANYGIDTDLTTCSYTEYSPSWWRIDLGKYYNITEVEIDNSLTNFTGLFARYISVLISVTETEENEILCNNFKGSNAIAIVRNIICLNPTDGRYVTIKNQNHDGNLILCDVRIYAMPSNFDESKDCSTTKLIIGVVVGVGLLLLILIALMIYCLRFKKCCKKSENLATTVSYAENPDSNKEYNDTEIEHTYTNLTAQGANTRADKLKQND